VFVLVVSVVALGVRPSFVVVAGVLAVVAGIVLVHGVERGSGGGARARRRGVHRRLHARRRRGIEHAAAVPYLAAVLVPTALVLLTYDAARGRSPLPALNVRTALAGVAMAGAYLLTLAALDRAAAAPVAAVREASVLIALVAVGIVGREHVTPARAVGGALVVLGVAALALG
jgi:drug/metabolite transporter (DMT)-like permease